MVDILWSRGQFENVRIADLLWQRPDFRSGWARNNRITVAWDADTLCHKWSRIGIDSCWNKLSDAAIRLYWPRVDELGKRMWKSISKEIDSILDRTSDAHRAFIRDGSGYCAVNMTPVWGDC